jgi:hypothetical protein
LASATVSGQYATAATAATAATSGVAVEDDIAIMNAMKYKI